MTMNLTKIAFLSRVFMIALQFVLNNLFSDDPPDYAFMSPQDPLKKLTFCDKLIEFFLGGFKHWDGEFFLHIIHYGYTYENTMAFFPLYPIVVKLIQSAVTPITPLVSVRQMAVLVGVMVNVFFFVKATNALYELGKKILNDERKAEIAAILFCINPASIFFSAMYTESLYSWISFTLMLKCFDNLNSMMIEVLLGLSVLCRSNGMLNIGFIAYYGLQKVVSEKSLRTFVIVTLKILSCIIAVILCFALVEMYGYHLFCFRRLYNFPRHIKKFAIERQLPVAGNYSYFSNSSLWCEKPIPIPYNYVQDHYWNVGFFKYYVPQHIPLFLLAVPMIAIILGHAGRYFKKNVDYCVRLGIFNVKQLNTTVEDRNLFVYIVHAVGLCIFCILFINIEVVTRLLIASNPMFCFFCAEHFVTFYPFYEALKKGEKNDLSKIGETTLAEVYDLIKANLLQLVLVGYNVGFILAGTFRFVNWYRWT